MKKLFFAVLLLTLASTCTLQAQPYAIGDKVGGGVVYKRRIGYTLDRAHGLHFFQISENFLSL